MEGFKSNPYWIVCPVVSSGDVFFFFVQVSRKRNLDEMVYLLLEVWRGLENTVDNKSEHPPGQYH